MALAEGRTGQDVPGSRTTKATGGRSWRRVPLVFPRCERCLVRAAAASAATCSRTRPMTGVRGATYCSRTAGHDLIPLAATPLGLPLQPLPATFDWECWLSSVGGGQAASRQSSLHPAFVSPAAAAPTRLRGVGGGRSPTPPLVGAGRVAPSSPGCCRPRSGAASPLTMSSATTTSRPSTFCPWRADRRVRWGGAGACGLVRCSWCSGRWVRGCFFAHPLGP